MLSAKSVYWIDISLIFHHHTLLFMNAILMRNEGAKIATFIKIQIVESEPICLCKNIWRERPRRNVFQ